MNVGVFLQAELNHQVISFQRVGMFIDRGAIGGLGVTLPRSCQALFDELFRNATLLKEAAESFLADILDRYHFARRGADEYKPLFPVPLADFFDRDFHGPSPLV
jgi:hypothetical protein